MKKVIGHKTRVFRFSLNFCLEHFYSKKNGERYDHESILVFT
jgi:hypothetical protein